MQITELNNKKPKKAWRLAIAPDLFRKVFKQAWKREMGPIKTHARASHILPEYVGLDFQVHDGKTHKLVSPTENMIGHRFGEFVATRKFKGHTNKNKK